MITNNCESEEELLAALRGPLSLSGSAQNSPRTTPVPSTDDVSATSSTGSVSDAMTSSGLSLSASQLLSLLLQMLLRACSTIFHFFYFLFYFYSFSLFFFFVNYVWLFRCKLFYIFSDYLFFHYYLFFLNIYFSSYYFFSFFSYYRSNCEPCMRHSAERPARSANNTPHAFITTATWRIKAEI